MTKIRLILILALLALSAALPPGAAAQMKLYTVEGTVTDTEGEPVVGAYVFVKDGKDGTMTDIDGKYVIKLSKPATIGFQFVGMANQEYYIDRSQTLNVKLKSDNSLEEAVISAGYGLAQKRSDMTGSAFQVTREQLKTLPAARVDNMLEGMVPGLDIQEGDYTAARSRYSIRVRGDASLNANSEPLWIVDGVPIYTGTQGSLNGVQYTVSPMSFLNPDDIESITVLKDAATTSIYGADGANGVILVTTRQSKGDGKLHITASMKYGISRVDRSTVMKLCNAEQWWTLAKAAWTNAGYDLAYFPYQDNEYNDYTHTDTDWYKVYLGTGNMREFTVNLDSGGERAKHYLGMTYYGEDLVRKGNDQQRFSIRDRSQFKLTNRLSFDISLALSYNVNNIASISDSYYRTIPIFSPYEADGVTPRLYNYYSDATDSYSPTLRKFVYSGVANRDLADNTQRTMQFDGNANLTYDIIKGLKFTSMLGVNAINALELMYYPKTTLDGLTSYEQDGISRRAGVFDYTWNNIDRLNFDRQFGKHRVGALLGIEFVSTENRSLYATGSGFANDHIKEVAYSITASRNGSSSANNNRSLSYLGTLNYSYDNRYYLSASYRRQGKSSFSTYSRWGEFTSVGASWNVHNEHFFNVPFINLFKIKGSFGNSGNSRVDTSAAYGTYTYGSSNYYGGLMGASQGSAPNPGLSWETTYITNLGLDLGLFDGRIDLELEWYRKYTKDMLYDGRVSSIISDGTVTRNVGEMVNRGFELHLFTRNISSGGFTWTTDLNGSVNRNIIKKLYKGTHTGFFDYVWMEGASKDAWWLVRWAGIDPTTGGPMWYDADGNVTFTFDYSNRVLLPEYSKEPKFRGGMRNTFTWGDFSLMAFLTYNIGGWDLIDYGQDGYDIISFNTVVEELDYWKQPGDVANNPKPVYKTTSGARRSSTRFLYSKTAVQFKNIALSYNIPQSFCSKLNLRGASIYLIGDNIYMWTPDQSRNGNSYKTLRYRSGLTRTFSAQLTLNF